MGYYIPVQPIPSQTMQINLGGQPTTLNVYQQAFGLYMDVLVGTTPIVQGIICLNNNLIIRNNYFGYVGDFVFVDSMGNNDPVYTGLSSRWWLVYYTASDLATFNLPAGVA
jgi:hypothetical protein